MVVNGTGVPVSAILLPPGSGSKEADQYALERARTARFEPISVEGPRRLTNPLAELTWGEMIFHWQTLPVTNSP